MRECLFLVSGSGDERSACRNCETGLMVFSLRSCHAAVGGMPPHMVPHNFAPAPFSAWGSYAAAAQQAGMQQQQQLLAFAQQMHPQEQEQDQGPAQLQAQMQHAHVQQMMMAGFLLGSQFGMVRSAKFPVLRERCSITSQRLMAIASRPRDCPKRILSCH